MKCRLVALWVVGSIVSGSSVAMPTNCINPLRQILACAKKYGDHENGSLLHRYLESSDKANPHVVALLLEIQALASEGSTPRNKNGATVAHIAAQQLARHLLSPVVSVSDHDDLYAVIAYQAVLSDPRIDQNLLDYAGKTAADYLRNAFEGGTLLNRSRL